jgi:hypothetical protein
MIKEKGDNKEIETENNGTHTLSHIPLAQTQRLKYTHRYVNIMPYTKHCKYCGKEYVTAFYTQKYCSVQCYAKAIKNPIKTCLHCNNEFRPAHSNQKYCSARCYHLASRTFTGEE